MKYTVNGESRESGPITVTELVTEVVGTADGVAVALNGDVVPRSAWERPITEGDVVDVLTAVQGG